MRIQHWFFFKQHPEKIPKVNKKPAKGLKSNKVVKATNNEQDVLDACWNKSALNKKLRNKIIKRIERVKQINKSQYPLTSRCPKPASKIKPLPKGMGKRNMSSVVLLIQQSNKKMPSRLGSSRNSIRPGLGCNTPNVNDGNYSFAGRVSAMDSYLTSSKLSKDPSANHVLTSAHQTDRDTKTRRESSTCRDNSVYEALRDQLQKITLKLDMEGIKGNDVSEWRQRRTRKERSDRNANLTNGSSLLAQSQSSIPLQSCNESARKEFHTHREKDKTKGLKRPSTRNEVAMKVATSKVKSRPIPSTQKNVSTVITKTQSKKGQVPLKKVLPSRNVGKKLVQQKENIQVNKVFKTTVA